MSSKISKSDQSTSNNQESPLNYADLFYSLPGRYIVFKADSPQFTFVEVSESHSAMTGVPREKILGRPFFEVFPDVSEEYKRTGISVVRQVLDKVIQTKQAQTLTAFRYDVADETGAFVERYWQPTHYPILDSHGDVAFIVQSSNDVTSEFTSDRRLEETRLQLQDALAIGKVGSWMWDIENDLVVANPTLAKLFGVDSRSIIDGVPIKTFLQAIHPDDRTRVMNEINQSIDEGLSYESEYRVISQEGTVSWVLARGRLETDKNHTKRFPGVIVDITERHNLETQIEEARLRDELNRRSSKLLEKRNKELETLARTKDEFVALASHQLRTPATAVKQYVGMVLQGYVGDVSDAQMDMLDKAFQSNERQIQIINQILNAARVDTGRLVMAPSPLDIHAQLIGILDEMRPTIEARGHTVLSELGTKPVEVFADPSYLRMAIENIIHNASIYTEAPGTVRIQLKKSNKQAEISVTDTGVGIKKADIPKLFTKFSRIHNPLSVQAGGSGIGLYLSAEIIRLHDGVLDVESKIRVGTTFTIRLPLYTYKPQKSDAAINSSS